MNFNASIADVVLKGISPISFSRKHDTKKLPGEKNDDNYEERTWRNKMTVNAVSGEVEYSAFGIQQALVAAAKYTGDKIPGQGQKTWGAKFERGVAVLSNPTFGVKAEDVQSIRVSVNADGIRGSGKRVDRLFPILLEWELPVTFHIIDPIITESVFRKYLELSGLYSGLGRFRPQNGGTYGRFVVKELHWEDNRAIAA